MAQGGMFIQVLATQSDGTDPLRKHFALTVLDQGRMSGSLGAICDRINQVEAFVRFSKEQNAAIRGETAAIEISLNLLYADT
jgi:hypothetical protein